VIETQTFRAQNIKEYGACCAHSSDIGFSSLTDWSFMRIDTLIKTVSHRYKCYTFEEDIYYSFKFILLVFTCHVIKRKIVTIR